MTVQCGIVYLPTTRRKDREELEDDVADEEYEEQDDILED